MDAGFVLEGRLRFRSNERFRDGLDGPVDNLQLTGRVWWAKIQT